MVKVRDNRRLGCSKIPEGYEVKPNKPREMLGFVPQPNLHSIRFLTLTEPYSRFLIAWYICKGETLPIAS
jgi:hypothetical protein